AMMSHELRTPLNAIAGYAELLELGLRGPVTEAQLIDLRAIRRNEQHLLTLIEEVLSFAKLDAGRIQLDIGDIKLAAAVESAISREIARAMGGDLTVTSVPGAGAEFILALPRKPRG